MDMDFRPLNQKEREQLFEALKQDDSEDFPQELFRRWVQNEGFMPEEAIMNQSVLSPKEVERLLEALSCDDLEED